MAAKSASGKSSKEVVKTDDKKAALAKALENIDKQFGQGAVMRLGDQEKLDIEAIPTGSIALDSALGIGGVPKGRITEIYGPESSGKTTVALHIIAECQKQGGTVAFIDAEHALDPVYAKAIGVDIDNLLISQPDYGEQALEICGILVRSGAVDLVVVDSVAALTPKIEIEGDMGDTHVGILARLMSQAMRKLTADIGNANCAMVFINQVREKIGISYGNPEVATGGRALKFYASVRIEVHKSAVIKQGDSIIGNKTTVKIVKNKVAPPFKKAEVDLLYGIGFSNESGLIDLGTELGIIKKSGAWLSYNGEHLGQGRENARLFLCRNPEIAQAISDKINASEDKSALMSEDIESGVKTIDAVVDSFTEDIEDFGPDLDDEVTTA